MRVVRPWGGRTGSAGRDRWDSSGCQTDTLHNPCQNVVRLKSSPTFGQHRARSTQIRTMVGYEPPPRAGGPGACRKATRKMAAAARARLSTPPGCSGASPRESARKPAAGPAAAVAVPPPAPHPARPALLGSSISRTDAHSIPRRPSIASVRTALLANSRGAPVGRPRARRLMRTLGARSRSC